MAQAISLLGERDLHVLQERSWLGVWPNNDVQSASTPNGASSPLISIEDGPEDSSQRRRTSSPLIRIGEEQGHSQWRRANVASDYPTRVSGSSDGVQSFYTSRRSTWTTTDSGRPYDFLSLAQDIGSGRLVDKQSGLARGRDCVVCGDAKGPLRFPAKPPAASCEHEPQTCSDCLAHWTWSEVDTKSAGNIKCSECPALLTHTDVQRAASPATFALYDKVILEKLSGAYRISSGACLPRVRPIKRTFPAPTSCTGRPADIGNVFLTECPGTRRQVRCTSAASPTNRHEKIATASPYVSRRACWRDRGIAGDGSARSTAKRHAPRPPGVANVSKTHRGAASLETFAKPLW